MILTRAGQYDRAIAELQKTLRLDPDSQRGHALLADAYLEKGQYAEALAELNRAAQSSTSPAEVRSRMAYVNARWGKRTEAVRLLGELKHLPGQDPDIAYDTARVYAALSETELTFEWLETAFRERSLHLGRLRIDRAFDPVRADRRYSDLMRTSRTDLKRRPPSLKQRWRRWETLGACRG